MNDKIFANRSPDFDKLVRYGFRKSGEAYCYVTEIMNGRFEMNVEISASGDIKTSVIDSDTNDPYTLHTVPEASGAFVGAVRADYERVLSDISENCFVKDVFKSRYARDVIKYIKNKYGDELQYLWEKFPTNAVWRRKDNDKWYGILLVLSKRKLGLDSDELVDIIDLRIDPKILPDVVDGEKYFLGYHMNKKNWFTMLLDGSVPIEEIYERLDESYSIAASNRQ